MILTLSDIKINVDFENLIPKLTLDQFTQLEENMVKEGRARNPLVIWKGHDTLVDGHNRLRVLKAHPELGWTFLEQDFSDVDEIKEWIIKNALGTRNLTEMQSTELRGRLYNMRKSKRGGFKKSTPQNGELKGRTRGVSEQIANELGVSHHAIETAGNFVDGLDAAEAVSPGFRNDVLTGAVKAQKSEIAAMRKQTPEQIKESISEIEERKSKKRKASEKALAEKIRAVGATMASVSTATYGLNELLREIDALGDTFLLSLDSAIKRRSNVVDSYDSGADKVTEHIDLIINKLNELKKGF